jgi:hypothetical protein
MKPTVQAFLRLQNVRRTALKMLGAPSCIVYLVVIFSSGNTVRAPVYWGENKAFVDTTI